MLDNFEAAMDRSEATPRRKSLRPIRAAILFWTCLLNTHPLAVIAQDLKLTGVANFRDIGGYPVEGGHKIKSGVIFRSGELSGLTATDLQTLAPLNIRYEIDLRRDSERSAAPSRWGQEAPQVIWIALGQARDGKASDARIRQLSQLQDSAQAKAFMQHATVATATDGAADLGRVLAELAKASGPTLIHCTAGKDRTGVTVAVLMTLLGASHDDIYHEYMLSNEWVDAQLQRQKAREQSGKDVYGFSGLNPAVARTIMGTDPSFLDAMFDEIKVKYGSFDAYTRTGLGITPAQITQLRKRLVEQ
jgi:protein-tyrosine phosphatase